MLLIYLSQRFFGRLIKFELNNIYCFRTIKHHIDATVGRGSFHIDIQTDEARYDVYQVLIMYLSVRICAIGIAGHELLYHRQKPVNISFTDRPTQSVENATIEIKSVFIFKSN